LLDPRTCTLEAILELYRNLTGKKVTPEDRKEAEEAFAGLEAERQEALRNQPEG
jgi:hypothetical protein